MGRLALMVTAMLALAPSSAGAASTLTLHGGGSRNVELGTNSGGIPFLWGLFGRTPGLFGRAPVGGLPPAGGAYVTVLSRETRAGGGGHRGAHAWTQPDGPSRVRADGLPPGFYPRHTGVFRAT